MVRKTAVVILGFTFLSGCVGASRNDFLTATNSFAKVVDSAGSYTTKRLDAYRKDKRANILDERSNQLKTALTKNVDRSTVHWDVPVDGVTLLCEWQVSYGDALAKWGEIQAIRQPLSDLAEPSKEQGFALFFESISTNYVAKPVDGKDSDAQGNVGAARKKICEADLNKAKSSLGEPTVGVREATGIPYLDEAEAIYSALDKFFGALGGAVDDQKRAAAIKEFLLRPEVQQGFENNISSTVELLSAIDEANRHQTAQNYWIKYLRYFQEYSAMVEFRPKKKDITGRVIEVFDAAEKLDEATEGLLGAADAYDTALDVDDATKYEALKKSFDKLTKLAQDDKISMSELVAEANRLKKIFDEGESDFNKIRTTIKGKTAASGS